MVFLLQIFFLSFNLSFFICYTQIISLVMYISNQHSCLTNLVREMGDSKSIQADHVPYIRLHLHNRVRQLNELKVVLLRAHKILLQVEELQGLSLHQLSRKKTSQEGSLKDNPTQIWCIFIVYRRLDMRFHISHDMKSTFGPAISLLFHLMR